ncbi:hypothetical protein ACEOWG_002836 [Bacillus cereus]|uniref:hypothetical protein n=1 Tax=Bacillus sp. 123MFChir2 TaxID=1169144 RepID=UPI00036C1929|nr:hypothetical protein [Bacillus sp. 123MFChir2]
MFSCCNFSSFPVKEFPAFGIAFLAGDGPISEGQPIPLPSNNTNPNVSVPVLLDVENNNPKNGLRVKRSGIYQLNYTLTVSLDNFPAPPDGRESATFFLTLNGTSNPIPGSGTAVRTTDTGTGLVIVTSSLILINLNKEDLIQIVPTEIADVGGTVDVRAATLTVTQIA